MFAWPAKLPWIDDSDNLRSNRVMPTARSLIRRSIRDCFFLYPIRITRNNVTEIRCKTQSNAVIVAFLLRVSGFKRLINCTIYCIKYLILCSNFDNFYRRGKIIKCINLNTGHTTNNNISFDNNVHNKIRRIIPWNFLCIFSLRFIYYKKKVRISLFNIL